MAFINQYPYFGACLMGILSVHVFCKITLPPRHHHLVILSGIIGILSFPLIYFFEDVYWAPNRIGGLNLGVEDILISYFVCAFAFFTASFPFKKQMSAETTTKLLFRRFLALGSFSGISFLGILSIVPNPMTALLVTQSSLLLLIILLRRDLWQVMLSGLFWFPFAYFLFFITVKTIWPGFIFQWNLQSLWGKLIFGMPLGELAWSIGHGAFWPLVTGYVYDIRFQRRLKIENHETRA